MWRKVKIERMWASKFVAISIVMILTMSAFSLAGGLRGDVVDKFSGNALSGHSQVINALNNSAPNAPTNPIPANGSSNIMTPPTLQVRVSDPDNNSMTVRFYNAANNNLISTVYNVSNNGNASVVWIGVGQDTCYTWYARASDANFTTQSVTWAFDTFRPYDRPMFGIFGTTWVLLSFPIQISGSPLDVFNDAKYGDGMTRWDVAKTYVNGRWLTYRVGFPLNTFNYVDNKMGVWLHIISNGGDQKLTTGKTGMLPNGVSITLHAGWTLIGYPSATPRQASSVFLGVVDRMAVYQSTPPYIIDKNPSQVTMSPGNGYWVHATADCVFTLNP